MKVPGLYVLKNAITKNQHNVLLRLCKRQTWENIYKWDIDGSRKTKMLQSEYGGVLNKIRSLALHDEFEHVSRLIRRFQGKSRLTQFMFQSYAVGYHLGLHKDNGYNENHKRVVIVLLEGGDDLEFVEANSFINYSIEDGFTGAQKIGARAGDIIVMENKAITDYFHGIYKVSKKRINMVIRYG